MVLEVHLVAGDAEVDDNRKYGKSCVNVPKYVQNLYGLTLITHKILRTKSQINHYFIKTTKSVLKLGNSWFQINNECQKQKRAKNENLRLYTATMYPNENRCVHQVSQDYYVVELGL